MTGHLTLPPRQESDTPGKAGGLMNGAASKAVALVVTFPNEQARLRFGIRSAPAHRPSAARECRCSLAPH
jgi:hypothetical protein